MSTRRVFLSGAVATAVGAALAACAEVEQGLPAPSVAATPSAHPALTSDKLAAVLERIQTGLNAADAAKSPDSLAGYLTGPAARVRAEQYATAQAMGDDKYIHTFITTSQMEAVGLTADFPRTALVVTEPAAEGQAPYLLILTQDDARSHYQLWGWAPLRLSQVPTTPGIKVGSESVSADATGLVATPQEVLDAYLDALNNPTGENGTAFADDLLRQKIASDRSIDLGGMGTMTVTAAAGSDGFKGLRTNANGALVMTTVTFSSVYRNTVARSTINVTDPAIVKMLGDNASVVGTVTATYDAMVAFSIPSASEGGQSVVVGVDRTLSKAERDDSQAPTG